jgi:enamine deaminase RidA (YjgF/YER057c/UK114 family)
MVFVSDILDWDSKGVFQTNDLVGQVRQALCNVVTVLHKAHATPEHIVRMTWYLADMDAYIEAYREIGVVFREVIGNFDAAMSAVQVSRLAEPRAKVAIEVTAVIPD